MPDAIDKRLITLRILHLAMLASVAIYELVVHVAAPPPSEVLPALRYAFAAAAVVTAIAVIGVRRVVMPPREQASPYHAAAPVPPPSAEVFQRAFTGYILCWGLSESVAIYGLVLSFLGGTPAAMHPYAAAAVLLLLTTAPRKDDLEAMARAEASRSAPQ